MINLTRASDAGVEAVYAGSDFADTRAPFFYKTADGEICSAVYEKMGKSM